jgi:hypothetical protein
MSATITLVTPSTPTSTPPAAFADNATYSSVLDFKSKFVAEVKSYFETMNNIDTANSLAKETKMLYATALFKYLDLNIEEFSNSLAVLGSQLSSTRFLITVYLKIVEFEELNYTSEKDNIKASIVQDFYSTLNKVKLIVEKILNNISVEEIKTATLFDNRTNNHNAVIKYLNRFRNQNQNRYPKRNVPKVDYSGMDTIEPADEENSAKINIWEDKTITKDPTYVDKTETYTYIRNKFIRNNYTGTTYKIDVTAPTLRRSARLASKK